MCSYHDSTNISLCSQPRSCIFCAACFPVSWVTASPKLWPYQSQRRNFMCVTVFYYSVRMLHHVECNFRGTLPQVKAGPDKGQPHHVTWPHSALVVSLVSSWYLQDCNLQEDAEVVCSSLIWSSQVLPVRQLVSVIYAVKNPRAVWREQ